MAENVKDSIDIEASVDDIFEVATDLEAYPEWNANIKEVEVQESDEEGRPLKAWFKVDAKIKVLQYTLEYDYADAPNGFSWNLLEGEVKDLAGSYFFDDFGNVTEVTYEMRIDPGFPVPGFLRRQAEKQIVRGALHDLKKRIESS